MDFDPDAYLASKGAGAATAAPPPFDPDAYLAQRDPANFDPNSYLAQKGTPQDRMQALSQLVRPNNDPAHDPANDAAYIAAYKDYYNQNPTGQRLSQTLKDAGSAVVSPQSWLNGWNYLWNAGKGVFNYGAGVLQAAKADADAHEPGDLGHDAEMLKDASQGVLATAGRMGNFALDTLSNAGDQIDNAISDATGDPQNRNAAAADALATLKRNYAVGQATANPYNAQTQPGKYSSFEGGGLATNLIPIPGLEAAGAGNLIQGGGDIIGKIGDSLTGAAVQGVAKAVPPTLNAAKLGGIGTFVYNHPMAGAGALLSGKLTGDAAPAAFSVGNMLKSASIRSGFFQGVDALGQAVRTTPLGDGVIDSIARNAPQTVADAQWATQFARDALTRAQGDYNAAYKAGESVAPYAKQIKVAEKAASAAAANQFVTEKGASFAQWLQQAGAGAIPGRLANAVSGTILGGALGGSIANLNSQPGQSAAPGAATGAAYGLILSQLGTAAASAQGQSPLRQAANKAATNTFPPNPPPAGPAVPGIGNYAPPPVAPGIGNYVPTGAPAPVAPAAIPTAPLRPDSIILDGVPHSGEAIADALEKQNPEIIKQVTQAPPLSQTYNYRKVTRELGPSGAPQVPVSDQQIDRLVSLHQPTESSAIPTMGYDPDAQMASFRMAKGKGTGKYDHYVVTEMPPDVMAEWRAGQGYNGSIGQYFNRGIRNEYPYFEVMESLFGQEGQPPPHTIGNPDPAPPGK